MKLQIPYTIVKTDICRRYFRAEEGGKSLLSVRENAEGRAE